MGDERIGGGAEGEVAVGSSWVTLSWVTLVGCTGGGGPSDDASGDPCEPGSAPTLEVGTGDREYAPMPEQVELIHGPQGGYHVVVAFEATHLDGSAVVGAEVTGTIDGEVIAHSAPWLELRCNPDTQTQQAWGILLIYSNGEIAPEALDGQPTVISATLSDSFGGVASAEVSTLIFDPQVE